MPGENLDLTSERPEDEPRTPARRPFIGIRFQCCSVYSRIYLNAERTAFVGHCPRCVRPIRLEISPLGSDRRQFDAY